MALGQERGCLGVRGEFDGAECGVRGRSERGEFSGCEEELGDVER